MKKNLVILLIVAMLLPTTAYAAEPVMEGTEPVVEGTDAVMQSESGEPASQEPGIPEPGIQESEIQESEIQEPEIQEPEIQEPEIQEPEIQEPAREGNGSILDQHSSNGLSQRSTNPEILLGQPDFSLNRKQTRQLSVKKEDPGDGYWTDTKGVWSSSNTDIATVSPSGLVTAKNSGPVTITYMRNWQSSTDEWRNGPVGDGVRVTVNDSTVVANYLRISAGRGLSKRTDYLTQDPVYNLKWTPGTDITQKTMTYKFSERGIKDGKVMLWYFNPCIAGGNIGEDATFDVVENKYHAAGGTGCNFTMTSSNPKVTAVYGGDCVNPYDVSLTFGGQYGSAKITVTMTNSRGEKISNWFIVRVVDDSGNASQPHVNYRTHVQTYGWQNWKADGDMSGTSGQSKRLEGIEVKLADKPYSGGIRYKTHVQTYGWQNWKADGSMSGTSGQSKRLEAIQIQLTGEMAQKYDVYYRVHAQTFGWMGWAKNGESAGTAGYAKRLEGIEIKLVTKGGSAPGSTANHYRHPLVEYNVHCQTYGWMAKVSDGGASGTSGQSKRLEGIHVSLNNQSYSGSIQYRTHIQTYGWESGWKSNGQMSGTSGQSKRLEAIQIQLTGEMAQKYDVYYRVHAQTFGWMGWARNGESAGTAGYAKRLEAIQIRLVQKGGSAPGSTKNHFAENK